MINTTNADVGKLGNLGNIRTFSVTAGPWSISSLFEFWMLKLSEASKNQLCRKITE